MESDFSLKEFEAQLKSLVANFTQKLQRLQTGRSHPSLLDDVLVEAYETKTPLNQIASVVIQDAKTLKVTPFDTVHLPAIGEAIHSNERLRLNPTDDGRVVYVPIPPLTGERRQQLVKDLQVQKENALIKMRQIRHQFLKLIRDQVSAKSEIQSSEKQLDDLATQTKLQLEALTGVKVDEILKI